MKKKQTDSKRKLSLSKTTLRALTGEEIREVVGGWGRRLPIVFGSISFGGGGCEEEDFGLTD